MASSKGRRKLRRHLQEAGLGHLLEPTAPPTKQAQPSPRERRSLEPKLWARSLIGAVGFLAAVLAIVQGYPRVDLQKDETLNPSNPYRSMFVAVNEGFAPMGKVGVDCLVNFTTSTGGGMKNTMVSQDVPGSFWHSDKFTAPCTDIVQLNSDLPYRSVAKMDGAVTSADMTITINYDPLWMNHLRRAQTFRLVTEKGSDGLLRWAFAGR